MRNSIDRVSEPLRILFMNMPGYSRLCSLLLLLASAVRHAGAVPSGASYCGSGGVRRYYGGSYCSCTGTVYYCAGYSNSCRSRSVSGGVSCNNAL